MFPPEPREKYPTAARSTPPGVTPGVPPVPAQQPPPPPTWTPQVGSGINLQVSKRLLWVGRAVYPLHSIARVHTFTVHPKRREATVRFLKTALIALAVAVTLTVLGGMTAALASGEAGGGIAALAWIGAIAVLIYSFVELMKVLSAQSHYVLAVETSGPSTAVVTSPDRQHLESLVGRIAYAIENPETEFQVKVDTIRINPQNYYFGDNVNMYGGNGNVGVAKA